MEVLVFIFSQSISYLVGILSGLSTNYIDRKIKKPLSAKSDLEINFKSKLFEIKVNLKKYRI